MRFIRLFLACLIMAMVTGPALTQTETQEPATQFTADRFETNDETGTLTATGNVTITQGPVMLQADRIEYNREDGTARATGNVIFTDARGGVHYVETLDMEANFSRAFARAVVSHLADGSWVSAERIEHDENRSSTFTTSRSTPCNCDFRGGETPMWELRSTETRHDAESKIVYHENVSLRLFAVPVMYFPFLWHPDWTVRRQTGLLPPRIAFSSDLGATYAQPFYIVTGDTSDVEITPKVFTNNGDALEMRYRRFWDKSTLNARFITGHLNTFKRNRETVLGVDTEFKTVLGNAWQTTARLHRTSQDTFMRRYDYDESEELKSFIKTEQIGRTHYSFIEAYDFQDLTSDRHEEREPTVLPHVFHERYLPSPRDNLALRLRVDGISLNNDDYTDVRRWTSEIYGIEEFGTAIGIASIEGRLSGQYRDIRTATGNSGYTGELGRGSAALGVGWAVPVTTRILGTPVIVEPKVKFVTARAAARNEKIPNRDSSDFRLDEANLFLLHRQQGDDFSQTHTRLDSGFSISLYEQNLLGDVSGFVGTSWRLAGDSPQGLNSLSDTDRLSDVLASLTIQPEDWFSLSWAGRFNHHDFFLNESNSRATFNLAQTGTKFDATYTQLGESFFTSAAEEKEDFTFKLTQKIQDNWSLTIKQKYDLKDETRQLEDSTVALRYTGGVQDCLVIDIGYRRDATTDRDIKPIDEVYVQFNFKYLGSVSSTSLGDN